MKLGFLPLSYHVSHYLLVDELGHVSFYARTLNDLNKLVLILESDTFGNVLYYHYDAQGRVHAIDDGTTDWGVEIEYHPLFSRITQVNQRLDEGAGLAPLVSYEYNERAELIKVIDSDGIVLREFDYDIMGRVASETNHAGEFANEYDRLSNLIQTQLTDGAHFTHLYYGSGHLLESRFIRGDKNHLLAEYSRDKLHREITRSQGALNLETQYDTTGRITRHSLRKTSQSAAFHPLRENRYEYNDVNELFSRHILTGDDKTPLTFAKRLSEYFEYDTNGQVLVHSPALEMKYLQEEHYKYDAAGNPITDDFHRPHWTNQTTRHNGQTYYYDGFGRLVQIKQQEKVVKQFEYDEHHRMINSVVKQGKDEWVAQYEYDALSRRISKTSQYYTDVYDHHRT